MVKSYTLTFFAAVMASGCSLILPLSDDYVFANDGGPVVASDAGADGGAPVDAGRHPDADAGADRDAGSDAAQDAAPSGAPNLTVACGAASDIAGPGATVMVPWTAANIGVSAGGPFTIGVLMEHPLTGFEEVGTERFPGRLAADDTTTGFVSFTAPSWTVGGANNLRCAIDYDMEVAESDEEDNGDDATVAATELPDLRMEVLSASLVGTQAVYSFRLHNDGASAVASASWEVTAYCSAGIGVIGSASGIFLEPGTSVHTSESPDIGPCLDGSAGTQLTFYADRMDSVSESDESNNNAGRTIGYE